MLHLHPFPLARLNLFKTASFIPI